MRAPTASQYRAIVASGQHVLVNAGAGSGKTSTVIGRILHLLGVDTPRPDEVKEVLPVSAPLQLTQIAAITFTNAAAADLKQRLRQELRAAGLRQKVYEVDGARIGTIHSFCADVLREFALRAGTSPAFEALEESEAISLKLEAVRGAFLQAVEEGFAGLDSLLAAHSLKHVEEWLLELVADSDRLARLDRHRDNLGELEVVMLELALRASRAVAAELERAGAIDFDRMITRTRDLLRDDPAVRRMLQRRIHTLIVDEFQDVDPAQKEIAFLLGEPETRRSTTTRLLLVGDPKQSIFRFRRADVTLWSQVQDEFTAANLGLIVPLEENFRSVPEIIGFVDQVIGPILDEPIDGMALQSFEAPFQPLLPKARVERRLEGPSIEVIVVPANDEGKAPNAEVVRTAEAATMAQRAVAFHNAGVPWREMAVLLTGWGELGIYEGALRAAGVPTYSLRAEGFYQTREVQDLVLALEAVRDPRDDRALMGFLRSPFVGLRDESLLAIARGSARPYFDDLGDVTLGEQARLDWAMTLLRELAALRDRMPLHELLESLLERSGFVAHLAMRGEEGRQPLANVRQFVSLARQHASLNTGDFLRQVHDIAASETRVGEARLFGESDDVMLVTSVHSAKGLQWRVVFWCDLVRGSHKPSASTIAIGRDRFVLKLPDVKPEEQSADWKHLLAAETEEDQAERKRLWYVAATRAEERLVLGGIPMGTGPKGAAAVLRYHLRDLSSNDGERIDVGTEALPAKALIVRAQVIGESEANQPLEESEATLRARLPDAVVPMVAPAGRPRHSATELLTWQRCPRKHWFRYVAGLKEPEIDRGSGGYIDAVTRGQIVHDLLETLEEETDLAAALEGAIDRNDEDAPARGTTSGEAYRKQLLAEVEGFRSQPEYRALADRPGARRELPFLHLVGPDHFTEGKIDLASPGGDGLVLLDVKTSPAEGDAVAKKAAEYAPQRDVYVAAAEDIGGIEVTRFAFQFGQAKRQLSEAITPGVRASIHGRLPQMLASLGGESAAMARSPTDCRYCGYRKVGWCPGVPDDGTVP